MFILLLSLAACQQANKKDAPEEKFEKNYSAYKTDSIEEYAEYLGKLKVSAASYEVYNHFTRVKAAINWHGNARLIFLSGKDTLCYRLNSNTDFPSAIDANKLYFAQSGERYGIDVFREIICLPAGGCVNKEDEWPAFGHLSKAKADSVEPYFRGKFPPE
jgi:hypothetical protein